MNKSKAPDTRGKLESVKVPKPKKKKAAPKKKSFKEFKEDHKETGKYKLTPKKTKGQLFKEQHGYSRSVARAMRKAGVLTLEAYKEVRKANKKLVKKKQRDQASLAKANRTPVVATKKKK